MKKNVFRAISIMLLLAMSATFIPQPVQAKAAMSGNADTTGQALNGQQGKPLTYQELLEQDPSYQINKTLEQLENHIQQIENRDANKPGQEAKKLTGFKKQLEKASQELQTQFGPTRERLAALGVSETIIKRYERFIEQYTDNLQKTYRYIDEINGAKDEKELQHGLTKLKEHIRTKQKKQPRQELGSETLPFRNAEATEKSPILGASITPAYAGGSTNNTENYLGLSPIPEDLGQTIEVEITPDIQELADSLNHDPVKIYNYVLNNIDFQIYYGSVKTAQQVLGDKAGNDLDQASLLIALLRASGIPARYVRGAAMLTLDQLANWVVTKDNLGAVLMLANAGYPVSPRSQGVSVDHTWVEAFIPYRNYRGKANDESGKVWIPLDPSLKEYNFGQEKDISKEISFPWDEYLSLERSVSPIEYYEQKLTDYIYSRYPGKTLEQLSLTKQIKKRDYSILPSSTPFKVLEVYGEYTEVPDSLRQKIVVRSDGLNQTLNISQVSSKRITVSYKPATAEDETVVEAYGGLDYTPSYLIKLKPVLKIEGEIFAEGTETNVGEPQSLYLDFVSPGHKSDTVEKVMTVGDYYAIAISPQGLNPQFVDERFQDLRYIYSRDIDNHDGEELFQLGMHYLLTTESTQKRLEKLMGMRVLHYTTAAFISYDKKYDYTFESAYSSRDSGMTIDVKRNMVSAFSVNGETSRKKQFMMVAGLDGSYFEHEIYNTRYRLKGASTVKALQLANERGIKIYNINRDNVNQTVQYLKMPDYVKQSIIDFANTGKEITIPEQEIENFGTTIVGYIVMDPKTGAAGYLISGGSAGGKTSFLQGMGDSVKDWVLSGVVDSVKLSLKIYFPFREEQFYETAAQGLVRGYISGFVGTVKSEWNGIKELPKMAKEIAAFAWKYTTKSEFRKKVNDEFKEFISVLSEIWDKRSEILSAVTDYYMKEIEEVALKSLNIGKTHKYFNEFALFYGTGKAWGFLTVMVAETLIGAKIVTIIKDFVKAGKLRILFKTLQAANGKAAKYLIEIYAKSNVNIKEVFLQVVNIMNTKMDGFLIRYTARYFSRNEKEVAELIRLNGKYAGQVIAQKIEGINRLFNELANAGIKFNKEATIFIDRRPNGKIVWLEDGNSSAGFKHIIDRHKSHFTRWGVGNEEDIIDLINDSVKNQAGISGNRGEVIYDVIVNGEQEQLSVVIGDNGFIVTAYPN